jgi:uncharacterized protein YndB with AHSA1/START domain
MLSLLFKVTGGIVVAIGLFIWVARQTLTTVSVTHTFNAPIERVWILWNDPESMKKWWSPKDFTAPVIKNDLRVGGAFLFSMRSPQGEMFWNAGTHKEVIPQQRVVSEMRFSDENGTLMKGADVPVPGVWPDTFLVTAEFRAVDGKTLVTVQEEGIPLIMKMFATMGWKQQFEKLETLL